jgi:hypothetical protein
MLTVEFTEAKYLLLDIYESQAEERRGSDNKPKVLDEH